MRWIVAGLVVVVVIVPLLAVAQYVSATKLIRITEDRKQTRIFRAMLSDVLRAVAQAKAGARGYVIAGDERFLESYDRGRGDAANLARSLGELPAADTERQRQIEAVRSAATAVLAFMEQVVEARRAQGESAAHQLVQSAQGRLLTRSFEEAVAALDTAVDADLRRYDEQVAFVQRVAAGLVGTGSAGATLLVIAAAATAWRQSRKRLEAQIALEQRLTELRAAEARIHALLNSTAEAIYGIDTEGRCTFANPSCARMLGYDRPDELLGQSMHALIHHSRPDGTPYPLGECHVYRAFRERRRIHVEDEVFWRKDGTALPVEYWSLPLVHGETVVGGVVSFLDITQRLQALEQIRAASEEIRDLYNNAPCGYHSLDPDGTFLAINDTELGWLGYRREELIGRKKFTELVTPPGREVFAECFPVFKERGYVRNLDFELVRRDGTTLPVLLSATAKYDAAGNFLQSRSTLVEVADRKRAEQALVELNTQLEERVRDRTRELDRQLARLKLMNQITRAIIERHDLDSLYRVVAAHLERDLPVDYASISRFDGASSAFSDVVRGPKSVAIGRAAGLTELPQQSVAPGELAVYRSGRTVYLPDAGVSETLGIQRLVAAGMRSLVVAPIMAKSGLQAVLLVARKQHGGFDAEERLFLEQLSGHVAIAVGQLLLYHELHEAYETLRKAQAATVQSERLRAIGQLASGVAHDINNALSPATILADQLLKREANLSEKGRSYLEIIRRALDDVAKTVGRMREFYKLREDNLVLVPVRLNDLVAHVIELTRARWRDEAQRQGATIKLAVELADDLPEIHGNESELRDALTNLIFNAVDAMPQGGVLTIQTRADCSGVDDSERAGAPPTHVVVAVADTGIGMDEETRRRCVEPFFSTKGERGSGLGLAMVHGAARRHSARLEIDSQPGVGTTVRLVFALPTVLRRRARADVASAAEANRPLRVLLVDDEAMIRSALQMALEDAGHTVVSSDDGAAGIETFRTARDAGTPFDVVITDLGMPDVDGRAVAQAVKEHSPTTPVILLTGWGQHLKEDRAIPPHVDKLLKKPPNLEELLAALAEWS